MSKHFLTLQITDRKALAAVDYFRQLKSAITRLGRRLDSYGCLQYEHGNFLLSVYSDGRVYSAIDYSDENGTTWMVALDSKEINFMDVAPKDFIHYTV